jgi:hypothetical protein
MNKGESGRITTLAPFVAEHIQCDIYICVEYLDAVANGNRYRFKGVAENEEVEA